MDLTALTAAPVAVMAAAAHLPVQTVFDRALADTAWVAVAACGIGFATAAVGLLARRVHHPHRP